ncbi:hypothetical protein RRG38_04560 [Mycoplasmopsis felis]|nr:hypothetical protein [Mycoplasmopsis felis]WQQ02449.1 hypothetical protein RNN91_03970 [Mycoplasmopsis felis]
MVLFWSIFASNEEIELFGKSVILIDTGLKVLFCSTPNIFTALIE